MALSFSFYFSFIVTALVVVECVLKIYCTRKEVIHHERIHFPRVKLLSPAIKLAVPWICLL